MNEDEWKKLAMLLGLMWYEEQQAQESEPEAEEQEEADEDDEEVLRFEHPERQITLAAAQLDNPELQHGDFIEEPIESVGFGRIGAQTAKQVIIQKIREAERDIVFEDYQTRIGSITAGSVHRFEKGDMNLEDLAGLAKKNGEPLQISGKQELYEAIINQYIK